MVIAVDALGSKCAIQVSVYSFIRGSLHTGEYFDSCGFESRVCTGAETSADDNFHVLSCQKTGKGFVPCVAGVEDFAGSDFSGVYRVYHKLFSFSEMLKDIPVIVSNCNSHITNPFLLLRSARLHYSIRPGELLYLT
jgi:hypothetical protein